MYSDNDDRGACSCWRSGGLCASSSVVGQEARDRFDDARGHSQHLQVREQREAQLFLLFREEIKNMKNIVEPKPILRNAEAKKFVLVFDSKYLQRTLQIFEVYNIAPEKGSVFIL